MLECHKCGKELEKYYHDAGDHFGAGTAPGSGWRTKPCEWCENERAVQMTAGVFQSAEQTNRKEPARITVPLSEYVDLLAAKEELDALKAFGVDGWEGYQAAMDSLEDEEDLL